MMPSNSLLSFASSFLTSKSIFLAKFFVALDCNFMLREIMAAAWDAAVADSFWAV